MKPRHVKQTKPPLSQRSPEEPRVSWLPAPPDLRCDRSFRVGPSNPDREFKWDFFSSSYQTRVLSESNCSNLPFLGSQERACFYKGMGGQLSHILHL